MCPLCSVSIYYLWHNHSEIIIHNSELNIVPKQSPTLSYTLLRNYTEQFQWIDPRTGQQRKGFNPPDGAQQVERVPFYIKFVTSTGKVEDGTVVCISVDPQRQQRKIKFIPSGEIRIVYDYLVLEVDGTRFVSH